MNTPFLIPADVPDTKKKEFETHLKLVTHETGYLMLFAGDQKVEHLNDDFYGPGIASYDLDPEHLFRIAGKAKIGVFASQLGLVARYGSDYKHIPYLIKLNSKTNLVKKETGDPSSLSWYSVEDVMEFKQASGLQICGVGYTVYLGSMYEAEMLVEAAQAIRCAHQNGLLTVLWMYPRGVSVADESNPHLIAGAAGVACCLGSDFVKVNYPKPRQGDRAISLKEAVAAAGRTKLICAGGKSTDGKTFLQTLHDQIHIAGAFGSATGRNIHQKPLEEAIRFADAVSALTYENATVEDAFKIYKGENAKT
jgi:fructose-bisphosphate aldolase / 6-deoxy-5-ketofructose 1-phosphate synthase